MIAREQFVALGPTLYRVERPWGRLPPELSFAGIADVTVSLPGKVVVLLRATPAVLVFEPDGSLADRWSLPDVVAGHYIRASASGRLFLSDFDGHRIHVLAEDGRPERMLGRRDRPGSERLSIILPTRSNAGRRDLRCRWLWKLLRSPVRRGRNATGDVGAARTRRAGVQHASCHCR